MKRAEVVPWEEAIDHFTRLIRQDPSSTNYYHRAIAWEAKGELDIALGDCNEAIRLDPKLAGAYANRGRAWHAKGEYDKAIADYNEAIRLDPKLALAYNYRGIAWKAKGEYDKAIADYNEAIRLDPKNVLFYTNVARLLFHCPDAKYRNGRQAVEYATKACELTNWKQARSIALLAMAYDEVGDTDQAVQWATKAVGMVSESEKPSYKKILDLCRAGKPYR